MTQPFRLQGTDAAIRRLKQFGPQLQKKGLGRSLRKGAVIVKNAAVQNAKRIDDVLTAEKIWRNIGITIDKRLGRINGGLAFKVGVLGGSRQYVNSSANRRRGRAGQSYSVLGSSTNPGGDTWYWRMIEFGTSKVGARSFLQPALSTNVDRATTAVSLELNRAIGLLADGRGGASIV